MARVIESADLPVPEGSAEAYIGQSWNDVYVGFDVAGAVGWSFDEFLAAVHGRADELVADGYPVRVLAGGRQLIGTAR